MTSQEINQAISIATIYADLHLEAKAASDALFTLRNDITTDFITQEEKNTLYEAATILEAIYRKTHKSDVLKYLNAKFQSNDKSPV
jgi:hypothetical protein